MSQMGPSGRAVTRSSQPPHNHVGVLQVGVGEGANSRRLADAGLSPHQDRPPVAVPGSGEELLQTLENVIALQQLHKSKDGNGVPSGLWGSTPIPPPVLALNDLHKHYDDVVALAGCSLEVEKGRMLGFLGPNGGRQDHRDAHDLRPGHPRLG